MKKSTNQSTKDNNSTNSLWKKISSGLEDKINKKGKDISEAQNNTGDMGDTHTPVSRLDLTGLNRTQAKELIEKIIDEKLEMISQMEIAELKIDEKEKERQRAKAAERVNERRNRRKQRTSAAAETIVTEDGVYSDFKQTSVFDLIQPESFPFEQEKSAPIEGQMSMMDVIAEAEGTRELAAAKELTPAEMIADTEVIAAAETTEEAVEMAEAAPETYDDVSESAIESIAAIRANLNDEKPDKMMMINTSLDAAVDRIFVCYEKTRADILLRAEVVRKGTDRFFRTRLMPAVSKSKAIAADKIGPLLHKADEVTGLRKKMVQAATALAEKEHLLSEKMYCFVNAMDRGIEKLIQTAQYAGFKASYFYSRVKDYAESHKKLLLIEFGIGAAAIAVVTITIGSMTAYEYIYNGKVLGTVKNQEDVYKTIDIIGDKLSYQYDAEITINKDKDIRFKKVVGYHQDIDDKEDILNRLTYMRDMKANGHGIFVNNKLVAVLESEKSAEDILNTIQNSYIQQSDNIKYNKVGFAENVTVKDVETKLGNINSKEKTLEYMMTGAVEKRIHVVQSGETFSEIAKMYGLKQSELQISNPDVIPEKLQIGQEICLNQVVPLVTVQTVEVAQYVEDIPFEITYENTSSLYKNEQTVKSKGSNGQKDVVAEITRNNGIEVSRTEISSSVLAQPVSQVVLVGTKDPPPLIGTGTLIYPIRGRLTSRYGTRWGRMHSGIDLAAPIGTDIKAADGGKVIFAGYNGSLGYMVEIDHGGGRVTLYGHCSKLFVKKGDKVYQGQHIADVGNTGRSTGPHVHFEVHINGKTKNPLNYL